MDGLAYCNNANYLKAGHVCEEHYQILIELSKIRSEKLIIALREYFVHGKNRRYIYDTYRVSPGNLSRKINELHDLSGKILELYPHYLTILSEKI